VTRTLFTGGTVAAGAPFQLLENGAVLVDGDRIARVGPADQLAAEPSIDRTLDTRGCLVVPGFVNTHQHHWYLLVKGLGDGLILELASSYFGEGKQP
jgi:5-methylthioadenosine/S-adenosylhomocysteine deaminase